MKTVPTTRRFCAEPCDERTQRVEMTMPSNSGTRKVCARRAKARSAAGFPGKAPRINRIRCWDGDERRIDDSVGLLHHG